MKKNFEQGLRDKLNEIHTQPESHLWEQIEERLTETDFETIIGQKLDEIQKLEPSSVVWSKIEARLQLEGRFSIPHFRNWAVAASILFVLGLGLMYFLGQKSLQTNNLANRMPILSTDPAMDSVRVENLNVTVIPLPNSTRNNQPIRVNKVIAELEQIPVEIANVPEIKDTSEIPIRPSILEELHYTQLPDTTFTSPLSQDLIAIQDHNSKVKEDPKLLSSSNTRVGLETVLNYVFSKVFRLPEAHIKIEAETKKDETVWKIQFDSRLLTFSGNLPAGKK
jgi:hypothetical protein